jgi:hypothetical protein
MAARDYLQRFWPYFAIAGMVAILLGASVFIVKTLPPRTIVMATGAEGGAYYEMGIRYREILAQSGVNLQLLPTNGALDNLTRVARLPVGGERWIHPGRHHHQEGITGDRVAGHGLLRAAVVLLPNQWQSYLSESRMREICMSGSMSADPVRVTGRRAGFDQFIARRENGNARLSPHRHCSVSAGNDYPEIARRKHAAPRDTSLSCPKVHAYGTDKLSRLRDFLDRDRVILLGRGLLQRDDIGALWHGRARKDAHACSRVDASPKMRSGFGDSNLLKCCGQ